MKAICFVILFILSSLCALCADWDLGQNGNVDLYNFKSCGYDEQNRLSWQITGRKASVRGPLTTIEGCELVFFHSQNNQNNHKQTFIKPDQTGKVKVTLKANACDFNYAMGEIKSDQPIVIDLGDGVDISGVGFDVDLTRHVILLRSAVKLKLKLDKKTAKALKTGSIK